MKLASIREFRGALSGFAKEKDMVLVTNHGKTVGCFIPLGHQTDVPIELKKEFVTALGTKISKELTKKRISEKDVLDDFARFKKSRRR